MATLDSRFVLASGLEEYFIDKDTGLPLRGGVVTSFSDNSRGTKKPLYTLSGSQMSGYTFVELDNPVILTGNGTFSDGAGNDIVPYYFPYVGGPTGNSTTIDLYYITVVSSTGVPQFVRQAWPNLTTEDSIATNQLKNYVPNGQFLAHYNIPANALASPPTVIGQIPLGQNVTLLGPGGWSFQKANGFTSVDIITFLRHNSPFGSNLPYQNPRYSIVINRQSVGTDSASLQLQFNDVNKFANGSPYTFGFYASASSPVTITATLVQYFGSGSGVSQNVYTPQGSFDIGTTTSIVSFHLNILSTIQKVIGPNDDDFVALQITFSNIQQTVTLDDFMLVDGSITLSDITPFPTTTNAEMLSQSLAGATTPDPNGFDLYLPIIQGKNGYISDHSQVGKIFADAISVAPQTSSSNAISNDMNADGKQYEYNGYSYLGIPYARLGAKLWNSTNNVPMFGTGANFATAYLSGGLTSQIRLSNNSAAQVAAAADGTTVTHFTFQQITAGINGGTNFTSYCYAASSVLGFCNTIGAPLHPSSLGTLSGALVISDDIIYSSTPLNNTITYHTVEIVVNSGGSAFLNPGSTGKYFTFANTTTNYAIWFYGTNETPPTPSPYAATLIQVNIQSAYTASEVASCIQVAMTGASANTILCTAGSAITQNAWWSFTAPNSQQYYVWQQIGGVGTDPKPAGMLGIPVANLTTGSTAAQVAIANIQAINQKYFAAPQLQGAFLRGYDPNQEWDLEATQRFSVLTNMYGNQIGTFEYGSIQSHIHPNSNPDRTFKVGDGTGPFEYDGNFLSSFSAYGAGSGETMPFNVNVNWIIKY